MDMASGPNHSSSTPLGYAKFIVKGESTPDARRLPYEDDH
jgi:hypothetical protein